MNRSITVPKLLILIALVLLGLFLSNCSNSSSDSNNTNKKESTNLKDSTEAKDIVAVEKQAAFEEAAFEEVNIDNFKAKLAQQKKSMSPKEIIKMYYPAQIQNAGKSYENIKIETQKEGNKTIVTLVHDNQAHIVIQGHRLVMTLTKSNSKWELVSIVQQFKCWERKNGIVWGIDRCS